MQLDQYFEEFARRDWQRATEGSIRFALVGAGWWVREQVIPALENTDFCEPAVAVDHDEEALATVTEGTAIRGLTPDEFEAGEASDDYDAVYVATPNAVHPEHVGTAAELGKPVLCEKPMAATVEGARKIVRTCDDHDVTLMIAYRMQTEPAIRRVRELVRDGFLGEIVHVDGQMSAKLLDINPDPDQWRLDPELSGGTALADLGIYPLNTTRFVLDADPTRVQGRTVSDHPAFEGTDEHVAFRLDFPGGTVATCTASHNAYGASHLRFVGTEGEALVEPAFYPWLDRQVTIRRGGTTTTVEFEQVDQMTEEFDYFADCLLTGREPHPDGEHGLVDVEAIDAIYEAAEANVGVTLG